MNRFIKYIIIATGCTTLHACDKELSKPPQFVKVDATAITDQKSAQIALNGVYYRFANVDASSNQISWREHHLPGSMYAGYLGYGLGPMLDEANNHLNSGFAQGIWDEAYKVINAANGVIKGVNALSDASFAGNRKKEILGEAKFLRAYGHWRLLCFFAQWFDLNSSYGLLIRDELSAISNISKRRNDVKSSYDFILQDLAEAATDGPATGNNIYATKYAAMALKMRVLMMRGQAADHSEVIGLANTIMGSGNYQLEENLKDLFYSKGLSSKEVIMGLKPQPGQELSSFNTSQQYYPGAGSLWVARQELKDLLANDPRGSWVIDRLTDYIEYSPDTYYFCKYIPYGSPSSALTETSYAFRLSEVYLLQAEAMLRSGGSIDDARELIKTVMSKAGVTDFIVIDNAATRDALLVQNYLETARNLVGEDGADYLSLLRLPAATIKQLKPSLVNINQYILPIPSEEFLQNPAIGDQNPGYAK